MNKLKVMQCTVLNHIISYHSYHIISLLILSQNNFINLKAYLERISDTVDFLCI